MKNGICREHICNTFCAITHKIPSLYLCYIIYKAITQNCGCEYTRFFKHN